MKASTIGLAASALLLTGCVVREVHEIRYVREGSNRAPGASGATCDGCDAGAAPGAVMAETQPPPPLVEEPLDQPSDGYVWTDGYWDWNGSDWDWVSGTWVPPVGDGVVYIPPAYYATGSHCLYVPGRWARGPRVAGVRDHRQRGGRGDGDGGQQVRDHRSDGGGDGKRPPPRGIRDHRGEKPPSDPDVDLVSGDRAGDVVIRLPPRRPHRPSRTRPGPTPNGPDRSGDVVVPAADANPGLHVIDGDSRGGARDSGPDRVVAPDTHDYPDYVIVRPRQHARPFYPGGVGGRDAGRAPSPTANPPPRDPGAARSPSYWSLPTAPSRGTPPSSGVSSPRGPAPMRVAPPAQTIAPAAGSPSSPAPSQPGAPAAQPAGSRGQARGGHAPAAPSHSPGRAAGGGRGR
jgi:hypothetical protein